MSESDRLVTKQAILRHKQTEYRRKQEIRVPNGPGWSVVGSIHDCSRKKFTEMLTKYSNRLYVGWNPIKNNGIGCWEVWHKPSTKTAVYAGEFNGGKLYATEYKPNDFEHWVADLPYLYYRFIEKLKKMDAWENKDLISCHDDKYDQHQKNIEKSEDDDIRHIVRSNKKAFRDLLDYTQSGFNPLDFFSKK